MMARWHARPVPVILAVVLAGCLGGGAGSGQILGPSGAEYDENTGAIAGVVSDDSLLPVPEARVTLNGADAVLTAADGTFAFARIPPGTYTIGAEKEGFVAAQESVSVVAARLTDIRLTLVPSGLAEAFHETHVGVAAVGCGVGVRNEQINSPPAGIGGIALCAVLPAPVEDATGLRDQFRLDWMTRPLANMTGIVAESQWTSTQALGSGMRVRWYFGAQDNQLGPFLDELDGPSPLQFRFPGDLLRETAAVTPETTASGATGTTDAESCLKDACPFASLHYAGRNNLGPQYPADFGVAIEQRIDDYLTAFYLGEFPESFSALPDA